MRCVLRYARLVSAAIACLVGAYFTLLGALALRSGLSWSEMDLDRDGKTALWEFFEAADVATRSVKQDGRSCTEYFWLKDGRRVKVVCPEASRRSGCAGSGIYLSDLREFSGRQRYWLMSEAFHSSRDEELAVLREFAPLVEAELSRLGISGEDQRWIFAGSDEPVTKASFEALLALLRPLPTGMGAEAFCALLGFDYNQMKHDLESFDGDRA